MVTRRSIFAAIAPALATGCNYLTDSFTINSFSGDPFPTMVDTTSGGAIVLGVKTQDGAMRTGVLDLLSPVTLIDRGAAVAPSVDYPPLVLMGERTAGGPFDLPRARLESPQVLTLHPCADATCTVGSPASPRAFDAILGVDAFSSDALRLDLARDPATAPDLIYILPDVAGDETHRTFACDAVFPGPFRGGGTLLVGGTELGFGSLRVVVDTCLAPDPTQPEQSLRGTDVLLVASTAIGVSLLDRSAYERYREVVPTAPAYDALADDTVLLPSGPITGRTTTIPTAALVAKSSSSPRAPCRQVFAHHLLAQRNCVPSTDGTDCPCTSGDTFCGVPAMIELAPTAGLPFLIVDDAEPTLQALRTELRPDQPEVDGLLGTSALRSIELDVDYPNNRLLGRCTADRTQCSTRPELVNVAHRSQINGCIGP
jgi:hypothetical protein